MKVFISWSGDKSKAAAIALREWIQCVIQQVKPWVSEIDIAAGTRWGREIETELNDTKFGIICLTKSNTFAPWILFEAGALAKTIDKDTYVCPYLIDMEPSDIPQGPLTQFQAKRSDEQGTWELVQTINEALKDNRLKESSLRTIFEKLWQDLEKILKELPDENVEDTEDRNPEDMIKEILEGVRQLLRTKEIESAVEETLSTLTGLSGTEGLGDGPVSRALKKHDPYLGLRGFFPNLGKKAD
ncbi:MAG: TIR domain-containing protein [Desulfobacteraceae bacterium]|nr:MAG: TIR domain-containing protein [Desulfobacteraceae bacterium]